MDEDSLDNQYRLLRYFIMEDGKVCEHISVKRNDEETYRKRKCFFLNECLYPEKVRKFIRETINDSRDLQLDLVTGQVINEDLRELASIRERERNRREFERHFNQIFRENADPPVRVNYEQIVALANETDSDEEEIIQESNANRANQDNSSDDEEIQRILNNA
jgi:hypothetical protein